MRANMYTFHKQKRGQKAENRPRRSSPKNMMRSPPKNRFKGVNLKDFYASNFSRFNHKKTRSSFTTRMAQKMPRQNKKKEKQPPRAKAASQKLINTPRPESQDLQLLMPEQYKATPLSKLSTQVNTGKLVKDQSGSRPLRPPISRFPGSTYSSRKNKLFNSVSRKTSEKKAAELLHESSKMMGLYTSINRNGRGLRRSKGGFMGLNGGYREEIKKKEKKEGLAANLYAKIQNTERIEDQNSFGKIDSTGDAKKKFKRSNKMLPERKGQKIQKKGAISKQEKSIKMSDHFENIDLHEAIPQSKKQSNFNSKKRDLKKIKTKPSKPEYTAPTKMSLKKLSRKMSGVRYQTSLRTSPRPRRINSCAQFSPKRTFSKTRGSFTSKDFGIRPTKKGLNIKTQYGASQYKMFDAYRESVSSKSSKLECFLSSTFKGNKVKIGGMQFDDVRKSLRSIRNLKSGKAKENVNIYKSNFRKKKNTPTFGKLKINKKQKQVRKPQTKENTKVPDIEEPVSAKQVTPEATARSNISNVNINQININNINTIDQEFYKKCRDNLINNIGDLIIKSSKELSKQSDGQYKMDKQAESEPNEHSGKRTNLRAEIDLVALKSNICKEFENSLKFKPEYQEKGAENLLVKEMCTQSQAKTTSMTNPLNRGNTQSSLKVTSEFKGKESLSRQNHKMPMFSPDQETNFRKKTTRKELTTSVNKTKMASVSEMINQLEIRDEPGASPNLTLPPQSVKVQRKGTLTTEFKNAGVASQKQRPKTIEQTKSRFLKNDKNKNPKEEKAREINRKLFTQEPNKNSQNKADHILKIRTNLTMTDKYSSVKNVKLRPYNQGERVWETETGTELKEPLSDLDIFITDIQKKNQRRVQEMHKQLGLESLSKEKVIKSLQISAKKVNTNQINEQVFYLRKNLSNKKSAKKESNPTRKFCLVSLMEPKPESHSKQNPFDSSFSSSKKRSQQCQTRPENVACIDISKTEKPVENQGSRFLTHRKNHKEEGLDSQTLIELFDISKLETLPVQFFVSKFTLLLQIYCLVEKKQDFYFPLKTLSEMIQQPAFEDILSIFRGPDSPNPFFTNFGSGMFPALPKDARLIYPHARIKQLKDAIRRSFELEAVSVLLLFFLFVEGKNQFKTLRILELVAHNCFVFLSLLKRVFAELEWKPKEIQIEHFLVASNAVNAFKSVQNDVSFNFRKNNRIVLSQIQILVSNHSTLQNSLERFIQPKHEDLHEQEMKQSIEQIFQAFYGHLSQRGFITMSGSKTQNKEKSLFEREAGQSGHLKSLLLKKNSSLKGSSAKLLPDSSFKQSIHRNSKYSAHEVLEKERREICFGASKELKNILSQNDFNRPRTLTEASVKDRRNESILITDNEKKKLQVELSREQSRECVNNESVSDHKSGLLNTSMKVMNLSKNLSITDSNGRHSQILGISLANNKNSYLNDLSSLMDKTFADILNEKGSKTPQSHQVNSVFQPSGDKSFKKKRGTASSIKKAFPDETGEYLKHILDRKYQQPKASSFLTPKGYSGPQEILKKYASSHGDNFIIEEESGINAEDSSESAKTSPQKDTSPHVIEHEERNKEANRMDLDKRNNKEFLGEGPFGSEVVDFCLNSESRNQLFKVTEEDTQGDKFSITVNSDRFQNNSKVNSELNSMRKKANESEARIKEIYQVDLETDPIKKGSHTDIKLSLHRNFDEMSSTNDAKFNSYKSDLRNRHFNTQVPLESEVSQFSGKAGESEPGVNGNNSALESQGNQQSLNVSNQGHLAEGALLEKIQESFSDQEPLEEVDEEQDSNFIRETYTVDSSSDDQESQVKGEGEHSVFSDLSQIKVNYDEPNFILQPFYKSSYLPKQSEDKKGWPCLVLDLDETLIHFQEDEDSGQFLIRPYAKEFLVQMAKFYEIAAKKEYADFILDRIDEGKNISHRLYRRHCVFQNDIYLKDLSQIGRSLERTMIVDNNPESFLLQPENGILIKSWYDDVEDTALEELEIVLFMIVKSQMWDLRKALRNLRKKILKKTQDVSGS